MNLCEWIVRDDGNVSVKLAKLFIKHFSHREIKDNWGRLWKNSSMTETSETLRMSLANLKLFISCQESKLNETLKLTTLPSEATTTSAPLVTVSIDTTTNETSNSTIAKETTEDDYDAEDVQKTTDEEQEELEEEFGRNGSDKATIFTEPVTNEKVLHSGHIALIFASTLVVFSVLAYIGLVLWRSRLESRYGMRQQLVTEDDYYNNNDVRYFGL